MTVFDDLAAEQARLEMILARLDDTAWRSPSGAAGWTVADVVLHLAQSEESVLASASHEDPRGRGRGGGRGAGPGATVANGAVEDVAAAAVEAERGAPAEVFGRWQRARRAAMAALRSADPDQPLAWVAGPVKPATLATTRLTEHWAHGLDITGPLGIGFPDTARLRHVAWLAHRTLPYALSLAGQPPADVRCELTAPEGPWRYGRPEAESVIAGPAGDFCRVAVRRLDPAASALRAAGPRGADAVRALRTYAA